MNIMTKRGNHDNIVTYEHICDRHADLANIPAAQATLGSVAIVLKDEGGVLGVYMCNSEQEWSLVGDMSGGGGGSGAEIHICTNDEIDATTGLPSIENPQSNTFYLVPGDQVSGNMYDEYIWVNEAWEKFGSGGGSGGAQADWSQNTASAPDYVKNRTHWEENGGAIFFDTGSETIKVSAIGNASLPTQYWTDGVTIDFTKNINITTSALGINAVNVEPHQYYDDDYGDIYPYYSSTGEWDSANNQWLVFYNGVDYFFSSSLVQGDNQDIDLKLSYNESSIHKLDPKFYEQADWNENDTTSGAYIKNRICYDVSDTIYDGVSVNFGTLDSPYYPTLPFSEKFTYDTLSETDSYILIVDDIVFNNSKVFIGPIRGIDFNDDKSIILNPDDPTTVYVSIGFFSSNDLAELEISSTFPAANPYVSLLDGQSHTIKLLKSDIKAIDAKYLTEGQGDWNELDATSAAYIKNKTHGITGYEIGTILNAQNFTFTPTFYEDDNWGASYYHNFGQPEVVPALIPGSQYRITYPDGSQKNCKCYLTVNAPRIVDNTPILILSSNYTGTINDTYNQVANFSSGIILGILQTTITGSVEAPGSFRIAIINTDDLESFNISDTNNLLVESMTEQIQTLDIKYLPQEVQDLINLPIKEGVGTNSIVENGINPSYNNGDVSHVEGLVESGTRTYLDTIINGNTTFYITTPTVTGGSAHHIEGKEHLIENSNFAHVEGDVNRINGGTTNHVEGAGNYAQNHSFGHVEGDQNWLKAGSFSHVEGYLNTAGGAANHVEGYQNIASGQGMPGQHAEGYQTYSGGNASHTEGAYTVAIGSNGGHAEGDATLSKGGNGAHSEGQRTAAIGIFSHAEGFGAALAVEQVDNSAKPAPENEMTTYKIKNIGYISFDTTGTITLPEYTGDGTVYAGGANSGATHSEGYATGAYGDEASWDSSTSQVEYRDDAPGAHSEGYLTLALASASHTEGKNTIVFGNGPESDSPYREWASVGGHAEGVNTIVRRAIGGHAEGYNSLAIGDASHAEGYGTQAGTRGHAEGAFTKAGLDDTPELTHLGSHAEGYLTIANFVSHAEGIKTRAGGGTGNSTVDGKGNHAEGVETEAYGHAVHAEGDHSTTDAYTLTSHIEGHYNTIVNTFDQVQYYSMALHIEGYNNIRIAGIGSHIEGINNTVTAVNVTGAHLEGVCCQIDTNSEGMHVGGRANSTSSGYAEVIGNGTYTRTGNGVSADMTFSNIVRSDARRLDWNGNEWIAGSMTAAGGSLTIGSTTITEAQLQALLAQLS